VEANRDVRRWVSTDRPGESITVGEPLPDLELFSARNSDRPWSESHETFTIAVLRREGDATGCDWRTRRRSVTTISGQLMAINAGDSHRTLRVHAPAAFDVVKLPSSWIEKASAELGAGHPFHFGPSSCESRRVYAAVQQLVQSVARDDTQFEVESACHDVVAAIVLELGESPHPGLGAAPERTRERRLERVREYLLDHLGERRPSLEELERDSRLGKSQLSALFMQEYGSTMGKYWMDFRIAKARKLLRQGLSATQVATDLGFTDQAHFSRVFRERHGLPPGAWVKLRRANTR
jgi:AraC-like DNA-binding protein